MRSHLYAFPLAAGAIALGLTGLVFGDFPLQPQRVPVDLPGRTALVWLAGGAFLTAGALTALPNTRRKGALVLAALYAVWAIFLLVRVVAPQPMLIGAWLSPAEIAGMGAGGLALFAALSTGRREVTATARILFGLCCLIFGASHYAYPEITAAMVPFPPALVWAYATGTGHLLAGVAMLLREQVRLAATLEAAMCASFVLLVHVPGVIGNPASHEQWTMLATAMAITAAAWTMRMTSRRDGRPGAPS